MPTELLDGFDSDEPAREFIMEQDREIAEKSGRGPLAIKEISRVGAKKKVSRRHSMAQLTSSVTTPSFAVPGTGARVVVFDFLAGSETQRGTPQIVAVTKPPSRDKNDRRSFLR